MASRKASGNAEQRPDNHSTDTSHEKTLDRDKCSTKFHGKPRLLRKQLRSLSIILQVLVSVERWSLRGLPRSARHIAQVRLLAFSNFKRSASKKMASRGAAGELFVTPDLEARSLRRFPAPSRSSETFHGAGKRRRLSEPGPFLDEDEDAKFIPSIEVPAGEVSSAVRPAETSEPQVSGSALAIRTNTVIDIDDDTEEMYYLAETQQWVRKHQVIFCLQAGYAKIFERQAKQAMPGRDLKQRMEEISEKVRASSIKYILSRDKSSWRKILAIARRQLQKEYDDVHNFYEGQLERAASKKTLQVGLLADTKDRLDRLDADMARREKIVTEMDKWVEAERKGAI